MEYILSEEDFRGDINVAGTEQPSVAEELQRFIIKYEPAFVRAVLGHALSKAFYDGAVAATPAQRWVDLLEGIDWDWNGIETPYEGLKACAARYVYFYYMRYLITLTTTSGEKIPQADNSDRAQTNMKAIWAWNDMSKHCCSLWNYVTNVKTGDDLIYPEWSNDVQHWKFRPINQFGI